MSDAAQSAAQNLRLFLARVDDSPLAKDMVTFPDLDRGKVRHDICIASRRALRTEHMTSSAAGDTERIAAAIQACEQAAAAADAANDQARRVTAMRVLRNVSLDWPDNQRRRRERMRAEAVLRRLGVGFTHDDGGGINSDMTFVDEGNSMAKCLVERHTPKDLARSKRAHAKAALDACGFCGEVSIAKLQVCQASRRIRFCNVECSRASWKNGHKEQCAAWCAEAHAAAPG